MLTVYRVDRRENTPESRSPDNEASLARSDSGTGIETHSSLAAATSLSLFVLLLFFATQLPPYAAFTYLFPCRTVREWQWLIAQGVAFAAYNERRVASTYISTCATEKKASDDRHPHLRPCFNLVVSYPSFWLPVGRLKLSLLVADLCFLTFKPPTGRVIIGKPDVRYVTMPPAKWV